MFNYKKLKDNNKTVKDNDRNITYIINRIRKSDILTRYRFSKSMKLMFYLNILSIKKCGLKSI